MGDDQGVGAAGGTPVVPPATAAADTASRSVEGETEASAAPTDVPLGPDGKPLSKKKQKKLKRMGGEEGLEAFWKKKKDSYKQRVRERKAKEREEREAQWQALTEEERQAKKKIAEEAWARIKEEKAELQRRIDARIATKETLPQIVIDCDYEDVQDDKGIKSMASQISYAHSHLRREALPCWMHLVGLRPGGRLEEHLLKKDNFANWHLTTSAKTVDAFVPSAADNDNVIYLSGDSPNVIDSIDPKKHYVVGGLVDRNQHKGISFKRAQALNIRHARFPLDVYLQKYPEKAGICKTLTTYHVVQVLSGVAAGLSWDEAFDSILPKRNTEEALSAKPKRGAQEMEGEGVGNVEGGKGNPEPAAKKQRLDESS